MSLHKQAVNIFFSLRAQLEIFTSFNFYEFQLPADHEYCCAKYVFERSSLDHVWNSSDDV